MPKTWTAFTKLPAKDPAEALGEAMEELEPAPSGIGVFEIEDGSGTWEVGGYFTEAPDDIELALLAAAFGAQDFVVSEVPDQDWVDKVRRELTPGQQQAILDLGIPGVGFRPGQIVSLSPYSSPPEHIRREDEASE